MALELKQTVGLSQQLVITPQLQQAIKLLQLSRIELVEMVQQELLENPVLEETGEDGESDATTPNAKSDSETTQENSAETAETPLRETGPEEVGGQDGDLKEPTNFDWENYIGSYNAPGNTSTLVPDDLPTYETTLTERESLQDHLIWQLHLSEFAPLEEEIGLELIGNFNDDGYLQTPTEEIAKNGDWDPVQVEGVLGKLQAFDPAGVGARSLEECLLLQTRYIESELDRTQLAELVAHHLKQIERRDYQGIARAMKISIRRVTQLAKIVASLEPKPGRPYGGDNTQYITPDVFVYKIAGDYTVVLNEEGLPRLQISHFYRNLLVDRDATTKKEGIREYVQDKLRGAAWLIKSIHQRQRTLYKVTKCIVEFQRDFLDNGVSFLKPMILKDVADEIGVHESTVSRATSGKYVHTSHGIFELKYFFNNGIASHTGGDAIAAESVKNKLKQIIASEDVRNPYSDQELVELLKKADIDIARRTVAKYREILGIFPSSRRKQMF